MEKEDISNLVDALRDFFDATSKAKINALVAHYPAKKSLMVDYTELEKYDVDIADRLLKKPDEVITAAKDAIKAMNIIVPGHGLFSPNVRFFNVPDNNQLIEGISSKNLGELVSVKGVVTRRADVMHRMQIAVYKCQACDSIYKVPVERDFVPPKRCESCKRIALKQLDEESKFIDLQKAEIQELLEVVRGGTPAARIEMWLEDDLVNSVVPGDNVKITGILRLKPPTAQKAKMEMIYGRYLEINSVYNLRRDFEQMDISDEDVQRILDFSKDPQLVKKITESIAPTIYGHNEVKYAIALQLFGGTPGKTAKGLPIRDDIHILLIGDPGIAKCVSGDSKVMLADGSIHKIGPMVEQVLKEKGAHKIRDGFFATSNHDLLSLNAYGHIEQSKANCFWKLRAPPYMYEIETQTGRKIKVTPTHPFFTSSHGHVVSKSAKELKKSEFIATPRYLPVDEKMQKLSAPKRGKTNVNSIWLPKILTTEFARLLGYLVGDGYVKKTSSYKISFTNSDNELLIDFSNILKNISFSTMIKTDKHNTNTLVVFSVELGQILKSMGIMENSLGKCIPEAIIKSPNTIVKEFIKAYFDCKASIGKDGLAIVSTSREMLEVIQMLLLRFGIVSQLNEIYSRTTNVKNRRKIHYYKMLISGENAVRYADLISFTSTKKIRKLAEMKRGFKKNIDVVPNVKSIIKETRKCLGLSQSNCGISRSVYRYFEKGERNPSYAALKKIVAAFKKTFATQVFFNDEKAEIAYRNIRLLEMLSNSHIFWDKIKSVKKIKSKENWVYDLQVEPSHNFIANNIIVHNSRFLQSVMEIAPKKIYVSGKSVSGVGLTVAVEKDELSGGGWTLKAGALVLASGGLAGIDEFDKIEEEDRSALHEVMESQTVSIAKAGLVATFKAKTAILAAANPKFGRFNQNKNLVEQFDIPPSLMSRFDLIFPFLDVLDAEKDTKLAEYILNTHQQASFPSSEQDESKIIIDRDFLRKYIAYSRMHIHPKLTRGAMDKLKEYYVELRSRGKSSGTVPITPRYLEGLIRLSEANAKMRLSQTVEPLDSEAAINLMNYVLDKVMTDKETGFADVSIIETGKTKSQLERSETIYEIVKDLCKKFDVAEEDKIISEAKNYNIDEHQVRKILEELVKNGQLYKPSHGKYHNA